MLRYVQQLIHTLLFFCTISERDIETFVYCEQHYSEFEFEFELRVEIEDDEITNSLQTEESEVLKKLNYLSN